MTQADGVLAQFVGAAESWKEQAAKRRAVVRTDPAADVLEFCAQEVKGLVAQLQDDGRYLTVEQWRAEQPSSARPSVQTVRAWCRSGRLRAIVGEGGAWMIARTAVPEPRRRRTRA